ncbi:hypothetical protein DFS34DRAFT_659010 [Phlyctochytrium arcticum]|nr:hypothetical protein DFS34DRAFT_659010 [Phlyctochytrium arcticum]
MENVGDQGYDITFDNVTKKLTITSDAPFKIGNSQSGTTAWRVLGSEKDNSPNKATSYTFPYQVDLSNTSVLLLCSTSLNSSMNVLTMIPNVQSGNIIHYQQDSDWIYCGTTVSQLDLSLIDGQTHKSLETRSPMYIRLAVADEYEDVVRLTTAEPTEPLTESTESVKLADKSVTSVESKTSEKPKKKRELTDKQRAALEKAEKQTTEESRRGETAKTIGETGKEKNKGSHESRERSSDKENKEELQQRPGYVWLIFD